MAKGLPEPVNIRNKRIVRASCSSKYSKRKNFRTSASTSHFWSDNTSQIGPVFGSDKVTFSIELHTPLRMVKRFVNTIASSEPYTINSLLEMQVKAGDQNISIPLRLNNKRELNQTKDRDDSLLGASLFLRVKQPTATFISKQLQEEVERSLREREVERIELNPNFTL
ncbi:hypothetical protein C0993_006368 [Termitomyces sp. T159_Od127]|nr:hypothetical protein C0993_006368 [Termitomyces sp. T159_Od127]